MRAQAEGGKNGEQRKSAIYSFKIYAPIKCERTHIRFVSESLFVDELNGKES